MKKILFLFLLSFSTFCQGHETYFAFAEMEYDKECSCLEISIRVSSHDLNSIAENKIPEYQGLEKTLNDSQLSHQIVEDIILKGFVISEKPKVFQLFFEGFELNNDGNCLFFFKSERIESNQINVRFDLFMGEFREQQNKLIYIISKDLNTPYNFFVFNRQTEIKL